MWQAVRRFGKLATENANGAPPREDAHEWRLAVPVYLTAETNARQALAGTLSTSLFLSFESRTSTASFVVATSTHSPPLAPE
jgi:hypothetical protein